MNIGALRVLAVQECSISDEGPHGLRHIELYTSTGLLTLLWHGNAECERVVLCAGGAMGGLLGPGYSFFHQLGVRLAAEHNVSTIRVGYRRPNDLQACIDDLAAAGMLAENNGAGERVTAGGRVGGLVTIGHSFGGAVALGAACAPSPIADNVKGVVTLATQSAGCERADLIGDRPLLLVHGDRDEILPHWSSEVVLEMSGGLAAQRRLEILPGAGHLLREHRAGEWLIENLPSHIVSMF